VSVTVAMLVYRDPAWLDFALEGLGRARNRTPYRTMVVGNDAETDVVATGRLDLDFRNLDPNEHYLSRVYRAWNAAVSAAETDRVVLMNSDMYVSDWWLDDLVAMADADPKYLPCSLLVESGRIRSAMPEHVRNLGTTPATFDRATWRRHATLIRCRGAREPGRLYMPVLLDRSAFLAAGGYPEGNVGGESGDAYAFRRLAANGYRHMTAMGSIVYHVQEGEMRG
jgi:hypothetical protein